VEIERGRRGCPTVRRRCRKDCAAANLGWIHGDRSRFPENRRNIPPRVTTFATMEHRGPVDLDTLIREAGGLRRLAVDLVGESAADDVVQEALIAGVQRAPASDGSIRPWLVRVVRNLAAGTHRSSARRTARDRDAARPERLPSASDLVERMEVQRVVAEEVLALAEPYRSAILAVHFEGTSAEEYARSRGVPAATVRSWTKRGLDTLRARLDRRFGGDRSAWSACLLGLVEPAVGAGFVSKSTAAAALLVATAIGVAWWWPSAGADSTDGARARDVLVLAAPDELVVTRDVAVDVADTAPLGDAASRTVLAAPTVPTTGRVRGRVIWTPGGAPAIDVGLRLVPEPYDSMSDVPVSMATDREGRFAFDTVAPGAHRIRVDRSGTSVLVRVEAGATVVSDVPVPRVPDVIGRVLDVHGIPVAGAEVHLRESNSEWSRVATRSAADGTYRVESVDVWTNFYATAVSCAPSGMKQASGPLIERTIDLYLGGVSGSLVGRVVDALGTPAVDVRVEISPQAAEGIDPAGERMSSQASRTVRVDTEGRFVATDVWPGPCKLIVVSRGSPWVSRVVDVRPSMRTDIHIELPPTARIRGRLSNMEGASVEGFQILVTSLTDDDSALISSDAEGRYDTGRAPAGRVRLVASHKDGLGAQLEVELAPGADFEWSPVVSRPGAIRGRLVDVGGRPLVGRRVATSVKKYSSASTDDGGRFAFEGLNEQQYGLSFDEGGLSARAVAVPGEHDVVLVAERVSARVIGRMVDVRGNALPDLEIDCGHQRVRSVSDGAFEFSGLRRGPAVLEVRRPRFQGLALAVLELASGELRDVGDLVVPGRGSLTVRVTSSDGVPVGWVTPLVRRIGARAGYLVQHGWGPSGMWDVEELPTGEYELAILRGAALQIRPFSIRDDLRTELEVDLRFGTPVEIETVAAPAGLPLRDLAFTVNDSGGALAGRQFWYGVSRGEACVSIAVALQPGQHVITASSADGRSGEARVTVPESGGAAPRVRIEIR